MYRFIRKIWSQCHFLTGNKSYVYKENDLSEALSCEMKPQENVRSDLLRLVCWWMILPSRRGKSFLVTFPVFLSFFVCHFCLQCFLKKFEIPCVESMKCKGVIKKIKKESRVILKIVGPSNVLTPVIVYVRVKLTKQLTRISPLSLPWP